MTDRELDARIAAQHSVINTVDAANTAIAVCALPRPDDVRRLLALQDAVGDLSAALSHGHDDMSTERQMVAAIAQSALEAGLVEESRRPLNGRWEP
jgi:hypothetical protein